jgi:hypothetical protein
MYSGIHTDLHYNLIPIPYKNRISFYNITTGALEGHSVWMDNPKSLAPYGNIVAVTNRIYENPLTYEPKENIVSIYRRHG